MDAHSASCQWHSQTSRSQKQPRMPKSSMWWISESSMDSSGQFSFSSYRSGQADPPSSGSQESKYHSTGQGLLETVRETRTHLARCCQRLGVPFEFHCIASSNWENINIDELKINHNEVLAVNCLFRFKNLLDETVSEDSPRDAVLQLIREMRPDVYTQSVVNGTYNSPFFMTRFKEALYHFSALFDMIDANVPRDDAQRMFIESGFYGWEAMNAIACEGSERIERPETYKQWQSRIGQAGFVQLPLDRGLLKLFRTRLEHRKDKDFMVDEDNQWLLQGYKGRILYASSCWKPVD